MDYRVAQNLSGNPSSCLQFVQDIMMIWFCLQVDFVYKGTFTVSGYSINKTTRPQKQNTSSVLSEFLPPAFLSIQLCEPLLVCYMG